MSEVGAKVLEDSFEGDWVEQDGEAKVRVPQGWRAFWAGTRPEYKEDLRAHDGETSLLYHVRYSKMQAGIYRHIEDILPGTRLVMSAWGFCDPSLNMAMRVGIDPTGGVAHDSAEIRWSEWSERESAMPYTQFLTPAVTARSDRVTLFLLAQTDNWELNTAGAYWDLVEAWADYGGGGGGTDAVARETLAELLQELEATAEKVRDGAGEISNTADGLAQSFARMRQILEG